MIRVCTSVKRNLKMCRVWVRLGYDLIYIGVFLGTGVWQKSERKISVHVLCISNTYLEVPCQVPALGMVQYGYEYGGVLEVPMLHSLELNARKYKLLEEKDLI